MSTQTQTNQKTCSTCKYWENSDSENGTCHRNAPQTVTFEVSDTQKIQTVFPATTSGDWCGEHQPK